MADPITLGVMATGSIMGAVGSKFSADASASSYNYKAGIAQMNAKIARQNADWTLNAGSIKANQEGMKDAQEIGETKVRHGASGVDATSGSNAIVTATQENVAGYNQKIISSDAAKTAYGYNVKAAADDAEASMDRSAASNAETAGWIGVASSLLGGAGSVASKWTQGNMIGMGTGGYGSLLMGGGSPSGYGVG